MLLSPSTLSVLQRWGQAWALPEPPPEGAAGAGESGMSGAGSVQVKMAPPPPPRAGTLLGSRDVSLRKGQGRECSGDDPGPRPSALEPDPSVLVSDPVGRETIPELWSDTQDGQLLTWEALHRSTFHEGFHHHPQPRSHSSDPQQQGQSRQPLSKQRHRLFANSHLWAVSRRTTFYGLPEV